MIKSLKNFQESAVGSAVEVFSYAMGMMDAAGVDAQGKAVAIHDNGYVLIEAPDGVGEDADGGDDSGADEQPDDDVVWFGLRRLREWWIRRQSF